MLSNSIIKRVQKHVSTFWRAEVLKSDFIDIAQGKEVGHRIADYVDDKTTALVHAHYSVAFESNGTEKTKRSMGDLWLKEKSIYHPVNIKTGIIDSGQPNMVSLRKLLKYLLNNQIDAYYLLMVKFSIESYKPVAPRVYFLDMLDYLDFVTFDSGPGQIMLKAENFYAEYDSFTPPSCALPEKAERLMRILVDGDKRLFVNRRQKMLTLRKALEEYRTNNNFLVSPKTQENLKFMV